MTMNNNITTQNKDKPEIYNSQEIRNPVNRHVFNRETETENLVSDIIAYCKKWGMWEDVCIYAGGKKYSDGAKKKFQPGKEATSQFDVATQSGIVATHNATDVLVSPHINPYDNPEHEWVKYANPEHILDMTFEGPLYMLLRHLEYEVEKRNMSEEAKAYIIDYDQNIKPNVMDDCLARVDDYMQQREGWDPVEYNTYDEFLSCENEIDFDEKIFNNQPRDFESREEYKDFISMTIASKEATLMEYFMDEMEDELLDEYQYGEMYFDSGEIADHVMKEFDDLLTKYGLWYDLGYAWSLTLYRE